MMSKSFESVQKDAINLELELQQCKEKIKNDMLFKVNKTKDFCKEREQYFEIQDLKAQLQDKGIVIRVILTTSVSRPPLKSNPQEDRHDMCVLKSVAKPLKETVASESNKKPRNFTRKLYKRVSKTCSWWYPKFTPSGYKWKPKSGKENVNPNVSMPLGNASRSANVMDTMTSRRSTVSNTPLSSNSFAARRDCPIHRQLWVLKGNDLLTGSRGTDLYLIKLQDINSPNPIFLMAKATSSQAWLWHRRLSHLNFDTINLLSKNDIVVGLPKYTWTHFLRSKDETPEVLIDFLRLVQRGIQAQVRVVQTDKGTKFLNQTLHDYFAAEGIQRQTSVARTPEQNGVVERQNRTLVEAARTMLSAAKVPLFFWAEAIATACFTQNRSLVIPRHEKTPYHIINDRKPSVKFLHIFGSVCYIVRDGEKLDKMKEKDNGVRSKQF
nr:putative ribonuclease H-like domain-containing protein [Tanacetum cinerariifolium]